MLHTLIVLLPIWVYIDTANTKRTGKSACLLCLSCLPISLLDDFHLISQTEWMNGSKKFIFLVTVSYIPTISRFSCVSGFFGSRKKYIQIESNADRFVKHLNNWQDYFCWILQIFYVFIISLKSGCLLNLIFNSWWCGGTLWILPFIVEV